MSQVREEIDEHLTCTGWMGLLALVGVGNLRRIGRGRGRGRAWARVGGRGLGRGEGNAMACPEPAAVPVRVVDIG